MEVFEKSRKGIFLLLDSLFINLSYILAMYFSLSYGHFRLYLGHYKEKVLIITLLYLLVFASFKIYSSLWEYASVDEFLLSIGACVIGNVLAITYSRMTNHPFSFGVNILAGIFIIILVVGLRMSFRIYSHFVETINTSACEIDKKNMLIFGAGTTGALVIKELKRHHACEYNVIGFLDDDLHKKGKRINGIEVLGNREILLEVVQAYQVDTILLAMPSMKIEEKKEILEICKKTKCKVQILPAMHDLINGKLAISKMRAIEIEDLLGRKPVELNMEEISQFIQDKTVLVTGGGGSIGSELCRQISRFYPKQIIIVDIYENNAYDLQNELKHNFPYISIKVLIASVRDKKRLTAIFEQYKPRLVFHAAAHKHVPLMEDSPTEAIKNNVFGTWNVAQCAHEYKVERFVLISTDKAVNPTNIMGASKRMCEMVIQSMDKISETQFVAVRFGNVLGSNGSVIPLFKKQIAYGGPVTVTSKNITRYFMTIPEAAQLVLQAGAYAKGGEIFVLDMGEPVKIYDLAWDLIKLSGLEPNKDILIEITGLRPGEKLYEELLMSEEGLTKTRHEKIFIGQPIFTNIHELQEQLNTLKTILDKEDTKELIKQIQIIVPTYHCKVEAQVAATCEEQNKSKVI